MDCSSQPIPAHGVQISSFAALVVVVIKSAAIALIIISSRGQTPLARWQSNILYPLYNGFDRNNTLSIIQTAFQA
jgi:hypothetical protein